MTASWTIAGSLRVEPARDRMDLLGEPVAKALAARPDLSEAGVVEIDPDLADTAEFCAAYGIAPAASANCVVVAGKRGGEVRYAAVMVLATMRADVNDAIRRRMDVRKASFAPMSDAVALTGMAYGAITPLGLPDAWPVLVDAAVAGAQEVVIGSGVRGSKLLVAGSQLVSIAGAEEGRFARETPS